MQPDTYTVPDLVAIPFSFYLIGCGIFVAQILAARQSGALARVRWVSLILILIGSGVAWAPAWKAMNPDTGSIYRMMLTRKLQLVQIGTPFVGLFLIAGLVAMDLLSKRYIRSHYMD